jgi:hypothetical protein
MFEIVIFVIVRLSAAPCMIIRRPGNSVGKVVSYGLTTGISTSDR